MPKPTPRQTGLIQQAVKTAAAATISLYASRFLKLPEGYWAALTAEVIATQCHFGVHSRSGGR